LFVDILFGSLSFLKKLIDHLKIFESTVNLLIFTGPAFDL